MAMPSPDEIAQELLSRGVSADDIAQVNPELGRRVQAGMIAPRIDPPDKIAARGAYIRDYSKINTDREELGKFYPQTQELDRFHALNEQAGTGGLDKHIPLVKDISAAINPAVSEMSSITSGLQGRARPVGSGSTSDFEQRLYRQGVPSPEKQGPTNDSIAAYQKGVLEEQRDRLAFQEQFLNRNGSLSGSQDAWARYVAANPYTVAGQGGRSSLNTSRTPWREHFGLAPAADRSGKAQGWTSSLPKAQVAAAKMYAGRSGTPGRDIPYVPASAAEFDKLPAGVKYIDRDGRVKTKRN